MNRLVIFILAGLFAMVSGLVAVTAFVTNSQVIIQAQPQNIISVDFGSVFPGQTVTKAFTISSPDSSGYTLTLGQADGTVLDIRPLITVLKDTAESDSDGPISKTPPYSGAGSFTAPNDLSDKWLITFAVPDITLPKGVVQSYGCLIIVTPTLVRN